MSELHPFDIAASDSQGELAQLVERDIARNGLPTGLEGLEAVADILIEQPLNDPSRFVHGVELRSFPPNFNNAGHFAMHCLAATVKQRSDGANYLSLSPSGFYDVYESSGLQGAGYPIVAGSTESLDSPIRYAPRGLVIASMGAKPIPMSWVKRK